MVQDTQSTSIADIVVQRCCLLEHDMAFKVRVKTCPEVDLDSSESPPQSTFEHPLNLRPAL